MVRPAQVGRSRGCQPCRTRRIKCDLTQPRCLRCLESGRACPGPLTGVLVIQAEQTASGKMRGKLLSSSDSRAELAPPRAPQGDPFALVRSPSSTQLAEANLLSRFLEFFSRAARRSSWTLKLPQLKNSPDAHALRSSLRAVSLAYFAHVTHDRAVQVESLRHYGQSLARQRSALTRLPNFFDRLPSGDISAGVDIEATTNALLATVILSYFELISPSSTMQQTPSSSAWINHTLAAERLITMLGPQSLSNDIIGQLFFSIRSHAVTRTAILGHYTIFSEKEWLEAAARQVPKQSYARSAYDRVTEWILRLIRLSLMKGRVSPRPLLLEGDTAWSLLEELERYYAVFLKICRKVPVEEMPLFITRSNTSSDEPSAPSSPAVQRWVPSDRPSIQGALPQRDILMQERPSPVDCMTIGVLAEGPADLHDLHPKLQKLFAAMTTAYFHAAAILLRTHFSKVAQEAPSSLRVEELAELRRTRSPGVASSQDDSEELEARFEQENDLSGSTKDGWDTLYNARVILAAGRYLAPEGRSNGTAVLRMMLPFSVVWRFCRDQTDASPELRQRRGEGQSLDGEAQLVRLEARRVFADWCRREGMSGLVAVGFAEPS